MHCPRPAFVLLSILVLPTAGLARLGAVENDLNLDVHGFISFGHLQTWGNNWLGPTREGSNEFWETGLNTTARPMDRLRLGAQLYARDLGNYDNGKVQLDLLYADYRVADALGIQVGRFKLPAGLFNESMDVDASRVAVFQVPYVYALRARDLFVSTDGIKLYGTADAFEYAAFFGHKHLDPDGGVTTNFRQTNLPVAIDHLDTAWLAGGMLHWHTPVQGLDARVTLADVHRMEMFGSLPGGNVSAITTFGDYYYGIASLQYETGSFTWVAEYNRSRARGTTVFAPAVLPETPAGTNAEAAYISATWHAIRWLDFYGAVENAVDDPADRSRNNVLTTVFATCVYPLVNWSVKAEVRDNHGSKGAFAVDNPDGVEKRWQVLALKTTVDF